MRIAYLDHGFHEKTKSTLFLLQFLQKFGHVDVYYDHSYVGLGTFSVNPIIQGDYDHVIVFQMDQPAIALAKVMPERLVFVPMYDGSYDLPDERWKELREVRILNFSYEMHKKIANLGLESLPVQFFPEPSEMREPDPKLLRGFFWQRTKKIDLKVVLQLIGPTPFQKLHVHQAPDPGSEALAIGAGPEFQHLNISVSHWFEKQRDFQRLLEETNIFFASRPVEGIGMSFLEAMARGQCVVAPNTPTMSEYIRDQECGILYDLDNPKPLDFSDFARLGAAAHARVVEGYSKWQSDLETRMPTFIFEKRKRHRTLRSTTRDVRSYLKSLIA